MLLKVKPSAMHECYKNCIRNLDKLYPKQKNDIRYKRKQIVTRGTVGNTVPKFEEV